MAELDRNKRITELYVKTVGIYNTIKAMNELDDGYFIRNWSVGLSNITFDMQDIINTMDEMDISFDYKQGNTFKTYCQIYLYMLDTLSDNLVSYSEGIDRMNLVRTNIATTFEPFGAFISSRIRDLDLLETIPMTIRKMYYEYEDNLDEIKEKDYSGIFDYAFDYDEIDGEDSYEIKNEEIKNQFGENIDFKDLGRISEIISDYYANRSAEQNIELDFD